MSAADAALHVPGRVPLLHARHAVTDALAALHDASTTRDGQVEALDTSRALERIRAAQSHLTNAAATLEAAAPAVADERRPLRGAGQP